METPEAERNISHGRFHSYSTHANYTHAYVHTHTHSHVCSHNTGAAVTYGLAVHLRIYPIIYAPALVLFLAARAAYVQHIKGGGRLPEKVRMPALKLRPVNDALCFFCRPEPHAHRV